MASRQWQPALAYRRRRSMPGGARCVSSQSRAALTFAADRWRTGFRTSIHDCAGGLRLITYDFPVTGWKTEKLVDPKDRVARFSLIVEIGAEELQAELCAEVSAAIVAINAVVVQVHRTRADIRHAVCHQRRAVLPANGWLRTRKPIDPSFVGTFVGTFLLKKRRTLWNKGFLGSRDSCPAHQ